MDRRVENGRDAWTAKQEVGGAQPYFVFEPSTDESPTVRILIDDSAGRFDISEVRVWPPKNAASGVTSDVMRRVPLGKMLAKTRQLVVDTEPLWAAQRGTAARLQRELERSKRNELPPSGRRGLPDAHFRRLAMRYLRLAESEPRVGRIVALIAEQEGRSPATVSGWIVEARRRQYLSPGVRGRGGAQAGPKLFSVTTPTPPGTTYKLNEPGSARSFAPDRAARFGNDEDWDGTGLLVNGKPIHASGKEKT